MDEQILHPLGIALSGLALEDLDLVDVVHLKDLLAWHGVLVVSGQSLDDAAFQAFLERFGDLMHTEGEPALPGFRDLNVVSNVGRTTPPRSTFHVDTSYVRRPPAYTALRAVRIPERGGETLFSNQYRAYDTLPRDLVEHLDGRSIEHVVSGVTPGDGAEVSAYHPVFPRHPISGRTSLYLTTPLRCAGISGLPAAEAAETIARLFAHSTRDDNVLRHAWSPGDVVMWDNLCVLHRADHTGVVGDRVMHRGMVAGYDRPYPEGG